MFIDDFSRYVWVFSVKEISKALSKLIKLIKGKDGMQAHNKKVWGLRMDNRREYVSQEFDANLKELMIQKAINLWLTRARLIQVCVSVKVIHAKSKFKSTETE